MELKRAMNTVGLALLLSFYPMWFLAYLTNMPLNEYRQWALTLSLMFMTGLLLVITNAVRFIIRELRSNTHFRVLVILASILIALSASLSYVKYLTFNAYAWDLGIFMQSLYTTAYYHRLFYYTVELYMDPSGSFLGVHFSPVLFSLVPIYYLFPHALTLFITQSVLIFGASLPLYLIVRHLVGDDRTALLLSLSYLLNPGIISPIYFDFHVEAFIPMLYFLVILYLVRRDWVRFLAFTVLLLSIIEYMPIIAMMMAIPITYHIARSVGNRRVLLTVPLTFILITAVFFTTIPMAMHSLNEYKESLSVYNPLTIAGYSGNPLGFVHYALEKPFMVRYYLLSDFWVKVDYYLETSLPLAPSILSPLWLLPAIPYIAFSIMSNYTAYFLLNFQYPLYFLPQLFTAYAFALARLRRRGYFVALASLALTIILFLLYSALSPLANPNLYLYINYLNNPTVRYLYQVLSLIPRNASVLTTTNVFPHLANRIDAYVIPKTIPNYTGYVMGINATYILISIPSPGAYAALDKAMEQGYGLMATGPNLYLFKLGYDGDPVLQEPIDVFIPATSFLLGPSFGAVAVNYRGSTVYHWLPGYNGTFFLGPYYLAMLQGVYNITIYMAISGPCTGVVAMLRVTNPLGNETYAVLPVSCSDFPRPMAWVGLNMTVDLNEPATLMISCVNVTGVTGLYFEGVRVVGIDMAILK
ncbi:DUF2079 domain-containing protein [Vulcanisaeta thermophila]|uniref:DUF2079 domain-containing protein n=1 Tax=Vulcanisaeta thermophila TaxID=867917 RepID=UPI000853B4D0|nr:DUF2079 domain-containing protein [Vulcanisaeta thermophila]